MKNFITLHVSLKNDAIADDMYPTLINLRYVVSVVEIRKTDRFGAAQCVLSSSLPDANVLYTDSSFSDIMQKISRATGE